MNNEFADYISVGKFGRPHGIEGWIAVEVYSGYPDRFDGVKVLFCEIRRQLQGFIILDERIVGDMLQMKLKDVNSRDDAKLIAGKEIFLPAAELIDLPDDEFFIHDLIGLTVLTEDGETVGELKEVMAAGANDVYVVSTEKGEVMVPAVSEFVKEIDLKNNKMIVHLWDEM